MTQPLSGRQHQALGVIRRRGAKALPCQLPDGCTLGKLRRLTKRDCRRDRNLRLRRSSNFRLENKPGHSSFPRQEERGLRSARFSVFGFGLAHRSAGCVQRRRFFASSAAISSASSLSQPQCRAMAAERLRQGGGGQSSAVFQTHAAHARTLTRSASNVFLRQKQRRHAGASIERLGREGVAGRSARCLSPCRSLRTVCLHKGQWPVLYQFRQLGRAVSKSAFAASQAERVNRESSCQVMTFF